MEFFLGKHRIFFILHDEGTDVAVCLHGRQQAAFVKILEIGRVLTAFFGRCGTFLLPKQETALNRIAIDSQGITKGRFARQC